MIAACAERTFYTARSLTPPASTWPACKEYESAGYTNTPQGTHIIQLVEGADPGEQDQVHAFALDSPELCSHGCHLGVGFSRDMQDGSIVIWVAWLVAICIPPVLCHPRPAGFCGFGSGQVTCSDVQMDLESVDSKTQPDCSLACSVAVVYLGGQLHDAYSAPHSLQSSVALHDHHHVIQYNQWYNCP